LLQTVGRLAMRPVANRARIFSPRAGMVLSYRSQTPRQDRRHDQGELELEVEEGAGAEIFLMADLPVVYCHSSASAFSMASLTSPQRVIAASSFSLMAL